MSKNKMEAWRGAPQSARIAPMADGDARRARKTKGPRTRGGWKPAGTAAARRAGHEERATAKGVRTRGDLLAAARRVFERDGYLETRVADIAAEAELAHGSFYTYFSSKQAVFLAVVRDVGRQVRDAVAPSPNDADVDAYEALDRSNRRYLEAYRANSVMWALVEQVSTIDAEIHRIRLIGRRQHVDRVARTIRRWQERGLADREIDPHTTAGALVSMLSNFAYWWLAGGDTYDADAAAKTLTDIWARAVGLRRRPRSR
jgi:AcrR family transcriptional regulator